MNTELIEAETALALLPRRNGWGGPRYKKRDRTGETISKPMSCSDQVPDRFCLGRGFLGGGCGKKFTPEHKGNFLCYACAEYNRKYG